MVSKLTKNPEKSRTGMAVTGPTNVATWSEMQWDVGHDRRSMQGGRDAGAGGDIPPTQVMTPENSPVAGKEVGQRAKTMMVVKNVPWRGKS